MRETARVEREKGGGERDGGREREREAGRQGGKERERERERERVRQLVADEPDGLDAQGHPLQGLFTEGSGP